jgi:hypothetical protein
MWLLGKLSYLKTSVASHAIGKPNLNYALLVAATIAISTELLG